MDAPPSGLQLGGKPSHGGHCGNEGQQGHQAEPWAGENDEPESADEAGGDIHAEEQADEEQVLQAAHIGSGSGDQFTGSGVVMPGKGAPLEGVVHSGPDVTEGRLGGPVADGSEHESDTRSKHYQAEKEADGFPK